MVKPSAVSPPGTLHTSLLPSWASPTIKGNSSSFTQHSSLPLNQLCSPHLHILKLISVLLKQRATYCVSFSNKEMAEALRCQSSFSSLSLPSQKMEERNRFYFLTDKNNTSLEAKVAYVFLDFFPVSSLTLCSILMHCLAPTLLPSSGKLPSLNAISAHLLCAPSVLCHH